jgi:lipopolysaccharide/colanic/teichoic acid biosynthesis glycosyltransferase
MCKRLTDLVLSVLGVIVLAPLLVLIALLVKCSSRGPVFYRGVRTGLHGKPFKIFKYRTMFVGADKAGGPTTGKNDPRVTRIGAFLRKHKLDELPQLFNVISGDMSLVGPRPEVPECTDQYSGDEKLILTVRPGITDPASLQFRNLQEVVGAQDPHQAYLEKVFPIKNALRVKYVKERTYFGDLKLLIKTGAVAFLG